MSISCGSISSSISLARRNMRWCPSSPTSTHVRYKNRYGRERSYYTNFEGAIPYISRRHAEAESDSSRERYAGFMRQVPCPACHGTRLKPLTLAVTVDGRSIAEYCALPIGELTKLLRTLELSERDQQIAGRVLKEINARLGFLLDVGLDYLTLDLSLIHISEPTRH